MKKINRLLSLVSVCILTLSMTAGTYQAAVYDPTGVSGGPVSEDANAASTIYPGDSIANVDVYTDPTAGPVSPNDSLEDGTGCWKNHSGTVYGASITREEIMPETAPAPEPQQPMLDEMGNPVPVYSDPATLTPLTDDAGNIIYQDVNGAPIYPTAPAEPVMPEVILKCFITAQGGTLEAIGGSFQDGGIDRNYQPARINDTLYTYDDAGNQVTIPGASGETTDAAAYSIGAAASLKANEPAEGNQFSRWVVYTVDDSTNHLNSISDDQAASIFPGLSAEALKQSQISIPVTNFESRYVFRATYEAVEVPADEGTGQTDENGTPIDQTAAGADSSTPEAGGVDTSTQGAAGADTSSSAVTGDTSTQGAAGADTSSSAVTGDGSTPGAAGADTSSSAVTGDGSTQGATGLDGNNQTATGVENGQQNEQGTNGSSDMGENQDAIKILNGDEYSTSSQTPEQTPEQPQVSTYALMLTDAVNQSGLTDVPAGTEVTVTADEKENMVLTGWTAEGIVLDDSQKTQTTITFTMPESNVTLIPQYATKLPAAYPIQVTDASVDGVEMSDNGDGTKGASIEAGKLIQVIAADKEAENLEFKGWNVDGVTLDDSQKTQAVITLTMPENPVSLAAQYEEKPPVTHDIKVTDASVEGVELSDNGDGTQSAAIEEGKTIQVTAADKTEEKLEFKSWTADGITLDGDQAAQKQISLTMPSGDVTLKAQYEPVVETETVTALNATIQNVEKTDNGDGSQTATVEEGTTVQIKADEAPEGQEFEKWNVTAQGEVETTSITSPTISITVGTTSVSVAPVYTTAAVTAKVTVTQPTGGTIAPAEEKTVNAGDSLEYKLTPNDEYNIDSFTAKIGDTAVNAALSEDKKTLTFTVPTDIAANQTINVTAALSAKTYKLTVDSGSGSGSYKSGDKVTISANGAQTGYRFTKWTVTGSGTLENETASQTAFTMASADATVTANYEKIPYNLTVNSGSGGGTHYYGEQVVITANTPEPGYRFRNWTMTSGSGALASSTASQTTFTMTTSDAVVTANYELIPYTLTVKKGSGSGSYTKGTIVEITPNFPSSGKEFDYWEKTSGKISFSDKHSYYTSVTMKASDATVTAVYKDGPNPNNNKITGLENGAEYLKSTTLSFTAVGAGMENSNPNPGDYRYRPSSYQIGSVGGSWTAAPYTTSMAINAVGDYTLTVTYAKDVYDGSQWSADGTTVNKSITFHVVNALSVKTGDNSPLMMLMIGGGIALVVIIIAVVVLLKKRKKKN